MNQKSAFYIVPVIACALILAACQNQSAPTASPTPAEMMVPQSEILETNPTLESQNSGSMMQDGSSQAVSVNTTYQTPGGQEDVTFTITVDADGVITGADTEIMGKTPTTITRQTAFAEALPTAIIGMKLSELNNIDRVGGSSLTTGAFNKALTELQAQI